MRDFILRQVLPRLLPFYAGPEALWATPRGQQILDGYEVRGYSWDTPVRYSPSARGT